MGAVPDGPFPKKIQLFFWAVLLLLAVALPLFIGPFEYSYVLPALLLGAVCWYFFRLPSFLVVLPLMAFTALCLPFLYLDELHWRPAEARESHLGYCLVMAAIGYLLNQKLAFYLVKKFRI